MRKQLLTIVLAALIATPAAGDEVAQLFETAVSSELAKSFSEALENYKTILQIEPKNKLALDGVRRMERAIKDEAWTPEGTSFEIWEHNGSLMKLVKDGSEWTFLYEEPRAGLAEEGVKRGTWLMKLHDNGDGSLNGMARIFTRRCGPFEYRVAGRLYANEVIANGLIPQVNTTCQRTGTVTPDESRFKSSAISE
jgi:hypothetical protein